MTRPPLVVIVGPTAAGKSALAIRLAQAVGGVVVGCDSQQVYRGMDIGTGKVPPCERAGVPHLLLDVASPADEMTAARYVELADAAIAGAPGPVVVCGGTGLYVRALLRGLFAGPGADPAVRARLDALSLDELRARVIAVDPAAAARILPGDRRRMTRALEVHELTGEPLSVHQARHDHRTVPPRYPVRLVGLAPPRAELDRRIDARAAAMFAHGLLDEVRALRAAGFRPPLRSQQAIGYAEAHAHLDGVLPLDAAIAAVQRQTRKYARRQLTWYRGDADVAWSEDQAGVDLPSLARYLTSRPA